LGNPEANTPKKNLSLSCSQSESFEWAKRAAMYSYRKEPFALGNFYDKSIGCIKNICKATFDTRGELRMVNKNRFKDWLTRTRLLWYKRDSRSPIRRTQLHAVCTRKGLWYHVVPVESSEAR